MDTKALLKDIWSEKIAAQLICKSSLFKNIAGPIPEPTRKEKIICSILNPFKNFIYRCEQAYNGFMLIEDDDY